jgi:hypothetical protein
MLFHSIANNNSEKTIMAKFEYIEITDGDHFQNSTCHEVIDIVNNI